MLWEDKFNSSVYILLPKFFFWNYKSKIDSKMKNIEVSTKDLLCKPINALQRKFISLPPCVPLDPCNNSLFSFCHFLTQFQLIIRNWGELHNLCSMLHSYWKNIEKMASDVCPWTGPSAGAPCQGTTTNVDTTNPPNNTENYKRTSNPITMPLETTSPVKG